MSIRCLRRSHLASPNDLSPSFQNRLLRVPPLPCSPPHSPPRTQPPPSPALTSLMGSLPAPLGFLFPRSPDTSPEAHATILAAILLAPSPAQPLPAQGPARRLRGPFPGAAGSLGRVGPAPREACEAGCTSRPCLSPRWHLLGGFITRQVLLSCSHRLALIPIVSIVANTGCAPLPLRPPASARRLSFCSVATGSLSRGLCIEQPLAQEPRGPPCTFSSSFPIAPVLTQSLSQLALSSGSASHRLFLPRARPVPPSLLPPRSFLPRALPPPTPAPSEALMTAFVGPPLHPHLLPNQEGTCPPCLLCTPSPGPAACVGEGLDAASVLVSE